MISLILIFPIIACLILFLVKKRALQNSVIFLYSLIHLISTICLCANINPFDIEQNFFALDGLNKIFLLVLSIVFMAFSIYNIEYMKDDSSSIKKLKDMDMLFYSLFYQ